MFEKVNPQHPDKVADRIAGALVDIAYTRADGGWLKSSPRIAVEVLIGHGTASVIVETSVSRQELTTRDIEETVKRICPSIQLVRGLIVPQDVYLSMNQQEELRVGDNGIFKGYPVTDEQRTLTAIAREIYEQYKTDGKYIIRRNGGHYEAVVCQSYMKSEDEGSLREHLMKEHDIAKSIVNPLGEWTGGTDVDTGATNRKLGSDMGDAVTGGGLHGKDLSKADVSVNIVCHIKAQASKQVVTACTAIGDSEVNFVYDDGRVDSMPFSSVVQQARLYIMTQFGSFEKFAEWGLIV